jgi:hypothetical protein
MGGNYILLVIVLVILCAGMLATLGIRPALAFLISLTIVITSAFIAEWWTALSALLLNNTPN